MKPNALALYTVVVFEHQQSYLLLQRSPTKRLWPNLWTGIGGRVEENELNDLQMSALREVEEETGITGSDITNFTLRRVLLHARPEMPLTLLLYFTGTLARKFLPPCTEGTLAWMAANDLPQLAIIASTRPVLPCLIADGERDPNGKEAIRLGIANFSADGQVDTITWLETQA